MQISALELSKILNGEVVGDPTVLLNTVSKIEEGKTGALSFLANPKYEEHIYSTLSSAVLVNKTFQPNKEVNVTLIKVDDAYASFTFLLEQFSNPVASKTGRDEGCFVDPTAQLGEGLYIGFGTYISGNTHIGNGTKMYPQVFIGTNVKIGKNCLFYPGVKIYHDCVIGDNVIIHSGTIVGSDGFGFAPLADRSYKKIPQIGNVIVESNVEIGSNTCIDRATMGSTIIRNGVKIDNLVQIAHNVEIGEHSVIAGQAGVAGSAKLGKYCVLGGQVAIAGHLNIADGTQIGGQTGVGGNITDVNKKWLGTPVMEVKDSLRAQAVYRRLPELMKRIEALEKELEVIKKD